MVQVSRSVFDLMNTNSLPFFITPTPHIYNTHHTHRIEEYYELYSRHTISLCINKIHVHFSFALGSKIMVVMQNMRVAG